MMIVSRRSYLLARPSHALMRCAGADSAGRSLHDIAHHQAEKQFAELMAWVNATPAEPQPVYLPPSLYDQAEAQGIEMGEYAKTPLMPTR